MNCGYLRGISIHSYILGRLLLGRRCPFLRSLRVAALGWVLDFSKTDPAFDHFPGMKIGTASNSAKGGCTSAAISLHCFIYPLKDWPSDISILCRSVRLGAVSRLYWYCWTNRFASSSHVDMSSALRLVNQIRARPLRLSWKVRMTKFCAQYTPPSCRCRDRGGQRSCQCHHIFQTLTS